LVLSDNLLLRGLRSALVAVDIQRSDEGVAQILVAPLEGGRALGLEGYFTAAQVDQIETMAQSGLPVELIHPRGTFQVLITDLSELSNWVDYVEPDPDDYETGIIQLIEV
jgi:hypothetical protein